MQSWGNVFGRNAGSTVNSHALITTAVIAGTIFAASTAAMAESVEPGNRFTTSWGELQSVQINPSSGSPGQGIGTDPNSHRYRDRGGEINFENDRQRFERKKPDGTVLRLQF